MKIYISGPITGNPGYKKQFNLAEEILAESGSSIMNPAVMPEGFEYLEYMQVSLAMLSACNTIALLPGWKKSKGAQIEYRWAKACGMTILEFTVLASKDCYKLVNRSNTPNKNND